MGRFEGGVVVRRLVVVVEEGMGIVDEVGRESEVGVELGVEVEEGLVGLGEVGGIIGRVERKV